MDWMWSWIPNINLTSENSIDIPSSSSLAVNGHVSNTGIFVETLLFILKVSLSTNTIDKLFYL